MQRRHALIAAFALVLLVAAPMAAAPRPGKKTVITKAEAERMLAEEKEKAFSRIVPRSRKVQRYLKGYRVIVSEHFVIFTNGPRSTLRFRDTLERLYKFTARLYPHQDGKRVLKCYIFKTKEEYFDYSETVRGFEGARQSAGHAYDDYYATFYQSPSADVVIHEATHLIVGAVCDVHAGGSWFQEGTAVLMESLFAGRDPNTGQKSNIRYGRYHPLRDFAAIDTLARDGRRSGRNYAQAGSMLDYMVRGPLKQKFPAYLDYLRKHPMTRGAKGTEKAIKAVYGMTPEKFDAGWAEHVGYRGKK